mgnify:FL=1
MNESENSAVIIEIRRMVHEMLREIRQVKRQRNMLGRRPFFKSTDMSIKGSSVWAKRSVIWKKIE